MRRSTGSRSFAASRRLPRLIASSERRIVPPGRSAGPALRAERVPDEPRRDRCGRCRDPDRIRPPRSPRQTLRSCGRICSSRSAPRATAWARRSDSMISSSRKRGGEGAEHKSCDRHGARTAGAPDVDRSAKRRKRQAASPPPDRHGRDCRRSCRGCGSRDRRCRRRRRTAFRRRRACRRMSSIREWVTPAPMRQAGRCPRCAPGRRGARRRSAMRGRASRRFNIGPSD